MKENESMKDNGRILGAVDKRGGESTSAVKKQISDAYLKLDRMLKDTLTDLNEQEGVNKQFDTLKDAMVSVLKCNLREVQSELDSVREHTTWDNLVVAFFGETNAGKSTIIETFRILFDNQRKKGCDGLIVGDGRHDFTQTYDEYKLSIAGVPFTLIDVPGIEGDEVDFKDTIKMALGKAHCVFYVQGHNKKPDVATAQKIKKYLGDWVKVYSIYNVRGGVSNYDEEEERETLLTDGVRKAEELMRSEFKTILGDVYAGHITLQGLLAMSAKARFAPERDDLIRGQQKLLRYFDNNPEKVLQFSQFRTLIDLVKEKAANFEPVIVEANKQKLISLSGRIVNQIEKGKNENKEKLTELEDRLKAIRKEVCVNCLENVEQRLQNKVNVETDRVYDSLKQKLFGLIDRKPDNIKAEAEQLQQEALEKLERKVEYIVDEERRSIVEVATKTMKELEGMHITIRPINIDDVQGAMNNEIDFFGALENLDVDFGDVVDFLGKIAGTAMSGFAIGSLFPGIGNIIGAVVGGVIGTTYAIVSSDDGKADARNQIGNAIAEAKKRTKGNMAERLQPFCNGVRKQNNHLKELVSTELENITQLRESLDEVSDTILDYAKTLKHKEYGRI